jgi:hypothetical protein
MLVCPKYGDVLSQIRGRFKSVFASSCPQFGDILRNHTSFRIRHLRNAEAVDRYSTTKSRKKEKKTARLYSLPRLKLVPMPLDLCRGGVAGRGLHSTHTMGGLV